jgi:hypothetical protein
MKRIAAVVALVLTLAACGANDTYEYHATPERTPRSLRGDGRPSAANVVGHPPKCFTVTWDWYDVGQNSTVYNSWPVGRYCRASK